MDQHSHDSHVKLQHCYWRFVGGKNAPSALSTSYFFNWHARTLKATRCSLPQLCRTDKLVTYNNFLSSAMINTIYGQAPMRRET